MARKKKKSAPITAMIAKTAATRADDVLGTENIGLDRLYGEVLASRDLLQGGGMENDIDAAERSSDGMKVPDIADPEFDQGIEVLIQDFMGRA